MKRRLILLASYPKSGNTWLRLVFNHLLRGGDRPVTINDMDISRYSDRRRLFDHYAPWSSSDLDDKEMDSLWPDVYRQLNADGDRLEFIKCHGSAFTNAEGERLYPPEATRAVLHLVRHPFDVAVSMANHFGWTPEEAVEKMISAAPVEEKSRTRLNPRLGERWGSWQQHYASWRDVAQTNQVLTMRYEDLLADPYSNFLTLVKATGISFTDTSLHRALELTRFESLQKQERENGFKERLPQNRQFFRAGRSGTWQGYLSDAMRRKLLMHFEGTMQQLGYGMAGEIYSMPNFG